MMVARVVVCPINGKLPVQLLTLSMEPTTVYGGRCIAQVESVQSDAFDLAGITTVENGPPAEVYDN